MMTQHFECNDCGWTGHEDDLKSECVFEATQEEPAEYDAWCPQCGDHFDSMNEITKEQHDNAEDN